MTFTIDRDALKVEGTRPLPIEVSQEAEMYSRPTTQPGSVSYSAGTLKALAPEVWIPIRLSLLSFEEDWNTPGMEAYDEM